MALRGVRVGGDHVDEGERGTRARRVVAARGRVRRHLYEDVVGGGPREHLG